MNYLGYTLEQRQNLYSRIDGLCNNLKQPTNGGAGTNFLHLVEKRKILFAHLIFVLQQL
jgi:hypothetical protein